MSGSSERSGRFAFDTTDGTFTDLTSNLATPGFTILEVTGANSTGQMSAIAVDPNEQVSAYFFRREPIRHDQARDRAASIR